jgi:hypothetical protein
MTGLLMPTPRRWATRRAEKPESWVAARPRTAAAGGRPQAGLEVVEKLLTSSIYAANKTGLGAVKHAGIVAP